MLVGLMVRLLATISLSPTVCSAMLTSALSITEEYSLSDSSGNVLIQVILQADKQLALHLTMTAFEANAETPEGFSRISVETAK